MRLDKYLTDAGIGTRSEVKKYIKRGQITVDGSMVRDPGSHVSPDMLVAFRGEPVTHEIIIWFMLHKPAGIITATEDRYEQTVLDLITEPLPAKIRQSLFPVGRLDRDTEGLLLITNDGETSHRLLSPKYHVDKTYYAKVSGCVTDADVLAFRDGLTISGEVECLPAELKVLSVCERDGSDDPDTDPHISEIEITIREGKYHQIKRMFRAVGHEVLYLKRIAMGPLQLDDALPVGSFRRLTDVEIRLITEASLQNTQNR